VRPLLAALAVLAVTGGLGCLLAGARRVPPPTDRPRSALTRSALLRSALPGSAPTRPGRQGRRPVLFGLTAVAGLLGWAGTGWVLVAVLVPAGVLGLPRLLRRPSLAGVDRLEAVEEWTRHLAGVLTAGVGLEQALMVTWRSTPAPIHPEVGALVSRLRAGWDTAAALRAFAEDLADATGDLVAASLLLSAQRRGAGLASVLEGLAASVADDVRARRTIEADRARPRATARSVTLVTLGALGLLGANGTYIAPYGTPVGQLTLAVLLSAYAAALLWMHRMTRSPAVPRFLGPRAARASWADALAEPGARPPTGSPTLGRVPSVAGDPPGVQA